MAGSDNESDDASVHNEATNTQQQPNIQHQIITTVSNNNAKFPYLKKDEYEVWATKMEYWITNNDMNIWKVIQNGNIMKRTGRDHDGRVIILPPTTAEEHITVQRESKAKTTLLQSIPDDHVADFHYMDDAKDIWNAPDAEDINRKFLTALPSSWSQIKEIGKKEEDLKALITVNTLVNWTNHDSESDGVITAKEFGMIVGCDSEDAIKKGAAKLYNLITEANLEEANTAGDAGEFDLMGVTSK
nr:xylulose kinase-1 [Tanacetum cinerariifolium]GFB35678.1 xylulose kinase-1 [Tanacetum cinerariifolium]